MGFWCNPVLTLCNYEKACNIEDSLGRLTRLQEGYLNIGEGPKQIRKLIKF